MLTYGWYPEFSQGQHEFEGGLVLLLLLSQTMIIEYQCAVDYLESYELQSSPIIEIDILEC